MFGKNKDSRNLYQEKEGSENVCHSGEKYSGPVLPVKMSVPNCKDYNPNVLPHSHKSLEWIFISWRKLEYQSETQISERESGDSGGQCYAMETMVKCSPFLLLTSHIIYDVNDFYLYLKISESLKILSKVADLVETAVNLATLFLEKKKNTHHFDAHCWSELCNAVHF